MSPRPPLIDTLAAALDGALSGRLFSRVPRTDAGDGRLECSIRWVRAVSWKRDVVELVYRRGRAQVFLNLYVDVPADGRDVVIDGTTVDFVVGRRDGYRVPHGLFRAWKRRRLGFRVDRDTRLAVDWFDEYDNPRRALQRLQAAERNGCSIGTDPHRAVFAFLESLGDRHPSRRELTEAFAREIPRAFGPLAERRGLRLREIEPPLFTLESDSRRVRIRFGSGHVPDVNILVGPASASPAGYDDRDPDIVGLQVVLKALAGSDDSYEPQPVSTVEDVRRELARAADLVERFYGPIFHGRLTR